MAVTVAAVLLLTALYLAAMRLVIDVSAPGGRYTRDERDAIYFWLHLGGVAVALVAGFVLGRWLRSAGLAYAVLLAVALSTLMVAAQIGSHELACTGHHGLIRHWTC